MGLQTLNSRIFDVTGTIVSFSSTDDGFGFDIDTESNTYTNVRSKYMNPLKTDTIETYEFDQQVYKIKASWLIRNSTSRTIVPNKMAYVVDGEYHHITGVRKYKGDRNLLVLDTIRRDNDTNE